MAEKMKVHVHLVVEVDPKVWADANGGSDVWKAGGSGYKAAGVRRNVREYVYYRVAETALIEETGAEVTLK